MKLIWKLPLLFAVCLVAFCLGNYVGKQSVSVQNVSSSQEEFAHEKKQAQIKTEHKGSSAKEAAPSPKLAEASASEKELQMLLNSRGRDLFVSLFEDKLLNRCAEACLEQIENRFKSPYRDFNLGARNFKDYEVRARLGLLKAMNDSYHLNKKSEQTNRLVHLYEGLIMDPKQTFSIQRQALFNLREHLRHRTPTEKRALMARLPAALIATGSMTESEMIEEVVNAAK